MENRIYNVTLEEMREIKKTITDNIFLAEIDGKEIKKLFDYLEQIAVIMDFPVEKRESIDAYNDWITDLDWLQKEGYAVIIYNYKYFMKKDPYNRNIIMDDFSTHILPWWQEDVIHCVSGGKPKPFNVYLVD